MEYLSSAGEVANKLGILRDKVQSARKEGAPPPSYQVAGRYLYTIEDCEKLYEWFRERGVNVNRPVFDSEKVIA